MRKSLYPPQSVTRKSPLSVGSAQAKADGLQEAVPDPPKVAEEDEDQGSVLSHKLPEPTSYSGLNLVSLNIEREMFRSRLNQALLLEFDGSSTYVDCGNPAHLKGGTGSLTIEAWVKPLATDGYRSIVSHGQTLNPKAEVWLRIDNGKYEFGAWDGASWGVNQHSVGLAAKSYAEGQALSFVVPFWMRGLESLAAVQEAARQGKVVETVPKQRMDSSILNVRSEDIGAWVHLAGVYDAAAKTWSLYRNGELLVSIEGKPPMTIEANWYIGAMREQLEKGEQVARFWKGSIADVRIWNVARTQQQIRANMDAAVPYSASGQLAALWRLQEGNEKVATDLSERQINGQIKGTVKYEWRVSPTGEVSQLLRQQPDVRVEEAFNSAKTSGLFDPLVFPRIRKLMSENERHAARSALADLTLETFKSFYSAGYHLMLQRDFAGRMGYSFVATPADRVRPQLFIVEEYRLSSFLGKYGVGRTLKTFSLLPGETTKISIRTASKSETTAKQATSILDSYSTESANEFESSMSQEQSSKMASSEEASMSAHIEGSASWGFGSCSASADASGSLSSSREEFGKSVSNATSKHASKASANRNVQIDTTSQSTRTDETSTDIVREIQNINVGRTLNFVFRQMNQEFISLLHLIDVRIGYTNGLEPIKEVPVYELNDLMKRVLIDTNPKRYEEIRKFIIDELSAIRDVHGTVRSDFVKPLDLAKPNDRYRVNKDFTSSFRDPTTKTQRTVTGVIISSKSIVMRTEDVVVEALIGESPALDEYAVSLQKEEIRQKQLSNERAQRENELLILNAKRNELLIELVRNKEDERLRMYVQAINPVPVDRAPNRVVSVWEDGGNGHG